ncbi:hypothetical protein [Desulforamulus ruminis]|nr:hypothetical protein [Desulforamulus ruminis]
MALFLHEIIAAGILVIFICLAKGRVKMFEQLFKELSHDREKILAFLNFLVKEKKLTLEELRRVIYGMNPKSEKIEAKG